MLSSASCVGNDILDTRIHPGLAMTVAISDFHESQRIKQKGWEFVALNFDNEAREKSQGAFHQIFTEHLPAFS